MIKQKVERRDGETVEIWLPDDHRDTETVNEMLDLQLNGIKYFYRDRRTPSRTSCARSLLLQHSRSASAFWACRDYNSRASR
jgi:hypothetical protein